MPSAGALDAMGADPAKAGELHNAIEDLDSFASAITSFTRQWKDLLSHLAWIDSAIDDRLEEIACKLEPAGSTPLGVEADDARSELRSLCSAMDGQGLRSYIIENRKDLATNTSELDAALLSSPDPAKLVLSAMDGFFRAGSEEEDVEMHFIQRTCQNLLERLHSLAPEIKPSVRDEAKKLAVDWKEKIGEIGEDYIAVFAFLQLVATFQLLPEFDLDEVLDLIVSVSGKKKTADLFKALGLLEKMPDLILKMKSAGRQLDAVKLIQALDLLDKHHPLPILRSFHKDCKKAAQEVLKKDRRSDRTQAEADRKELAGVRQLRHFIKQQKLDDLETFSGELKMRINQLELRITDRGQKKRAASNSTTQPQLKRPRLPTASEPALKPPVPYDVIPSAIQSQTAMAMADHRPYIGLVGSYGLPPRPIYDPGVSVASGGSYGLSSARSAYDPGLSSTRTVYDSRVSAASGGGLGAPFPARSYLSSAVDDPRLSDRLTPYVYSLSSTSSYAPSYR